MTPIILSERLVAEVYAHCEAAYPEEACGILVGPADAALATRAHPCANVQNHLHAEDPHNHPRDARTAYRIDPRELFDLVRGLRADGLEMKAIFHSHADVGAYFSDEDQRQAAPLLELSLSAFARGEGIEEADAAAWVAQGRVGGDLSTGRVRTRIPSYPDLVYLVVDVGAGRAHGFRGYFWNPSVRSYTEVAVPVEGGVRP